MAVTLFSQNNYTLANQVIQQPPTVEKPPATFEDLLLEAIEELKSVKNSVDDHRYSKEDFCHRVRPSKGIEI